MSHRWLCVWSVVLALATSASAQPAGSPLRFVPSEAEVVLMVDRPRDLVDAVEKNPLFQDVQKLAGVREYYDTATFHQLYQLLAHFEKQLGKNRNELLDDLGSGGVVLAAKLTKPGGAMLIIQAKYESRLRRFVDVGLEVLGQELERQESKDKIVRKKHQGIDVGQIGPKLCFAISGAALLVASEEKVLKAALETLAGKEGIAQLSSFADARKKAPAKALAWAWLNVQELRKNQDFQNGLNAASLDPLQVLLFGGFTDLLKRAPHGSAALTRDGAGYRLGITAPRGREGMPALSHMILPAKGDGIPPPLQVPRMLASTSFHLDLGQFWHKRVEILGEQNAKNLEDADGNLGKLLGGIKLSRLFTGMGPHLRMVVAQQKEKLYKNQPGQPIPAFALVVDMRDPRFAKDMNAVLRSAALASTFFFGLVLKDETYKDHEIITYHFSETKKVDLDQGNTRFNFSPSYVAVGNHFVLSATTELARDLIDALEAEKQPTRSPASMHTHLRASGLAELIRANEDLVTTQLILGQGLAPSKAHKELRAIIDWIERLGELRVESHYEQRDFRFDIRWQPAK